MPRARIIVTGFVQGVGFRYFTLRQARKFDVSGWSRNRADGAVEIEAEADEAALDEFIDSVKRGPTFSRVKSVDVEQQEETGERSGFTIRH